MKIQYPFAWNIIRQKKNENLLLVVVWVELENMLSEIRQDKNDKYSMILPVHRIPNRWSHWNKSQVAELAKAGESKVGEGLGKVDQ